MSHSPHVFRDDAPLAPAAALPLEATRRAEEYLAEHHVAEPRLEAELLLADVLGVGRLQLYLNDDIPLTPEQLLAYRAAVDRRAKREPLQYITGTVDFREIELRVDPRALIPRPETEVLVGVVLDWARTRGDSELHALDIGTGTGAIALSLLKEGGAGRVVATDVSADALELASENAAALGLADRIQLRQGSVYDVLSAGERFDVIVSNPPYIAEGERPTLPTEVVDWEPSAALFAGPDGLEVVEPIVRGALDRLARPGLLALEIAPRQAEAVVALARECGFGNVRIVPDLAGRQRVVAAETA